jgi:hypothetical protein
VGHKAASALQFFRGALIILHLQLEPAVVKVQPPVTWIHSDGTGVEAGGLFEWGGSSDDEFCLKPLFGSTLPGRMVESASEWWQTSGSQHVGRILSFV